MFCFRLVCLLLTLALGLEAAEQRLFVSLAGENRIASYRIDPDTGQLSDAVSSELPGDPRAMTLSRDRRFLFVSIGAQAKLASFRVDASTGSLSFLSESEAAGRASFLQMDKTGRFLISSYYAEGTTLIHDVRDGVLGPSAKQTLATAERAHSVALDPGNRFLFVSHTRPNAIYQFRFDAARGKAETNQVPVLKRESVAGPRHLRFDRKGKFGYGSDEQGNSVTVYGLNAKAGRLKALQTLTTLPSDYTDGNSTSDVQIHPNGRFVYVVNRGHDSIAAFEVDGPSGKLSPIGRFPCEALTRSFDFSPDGRFLYAAGSKEGKLAAYRVDVNTGRLQRFATETVGASPWWVFGAELP